MRAAIAHGCSVHEFLSRWSSAEITELMAYEKIEGPIGPLRGDYQAAMVSLTIANALGGKKRRSIEDFLIPWGRTRPRPLDGYELLARAKAINAALGGETRGG